MSMDFPSNSHKDRDEEGIPKPEPSKKPKTEKIISGKAVQRKKSLGRKIADSFTGEDARGVGTFILFEVLIPAAKNMFADSLNQGLDRWQYGGGDSRRRGGGGGRDGGRTAYNRMYNSPSYSTSSYSSSGGRRDSGRRDISHRARADHDFSEVVLESRGEAEMVLDRLRDVIDEYSIVAVSTLYDLVEITGSYTDDQWGWDDLRDARVRRVREGYLLDLPRTINLK